MQTFVLFTVTPAMIVGIVLCVIMIAAIIVLYFMGKKMQKKH